MNRGYRFRGFGSPANPVRCAPFGLHSTADHSGLYLPRSITSFSNCSIICSISMKMIGLPFHYILFSIPAQGKTMRPSENLWFLKRMLFPDKRPPKFSLRLSLPVLDLLPDPLFDNNRLCFPTPVAIEKNVFRKELLEFYAYARFFCTLPAPIVPLKQLFSSVYHKPIYSARYTIHEKPPPICLTRQEGVHLYRHRSIFPGRRQPSIFDTDELNFCVRYGNRCDLIAIDTSYLRL